MSKTSIANRGLGLEELIQKKCDKLNKEGVALISKVPTDWKVLRKFNPKTKRSEIFNAFPVAESKFVDFIGIMNGRAIAIESKETKNKTNFPFKNIKDGQFEFFKTWCNLDGLGYYIIRFTEHKEVYFVPSKIMQEWVDTLNRQSVPYELFKSTDKVILLDYKELDFEKYIN